MWASFFWHVPLLLALAFFLLGGILILCKSKLIEFNSTRANISFVTVIFTLLCTRGNFFAFAVAIAHIIPFLVFINVRENYQLKIFESVRVVFAWIIGISLIAWTFHQLGLSMPFIIDFYGNKSNIWDNAYVVENHFLYTVNLQLVGDDALFNLPRFCAIFLEPGYFASLLAIFLYVDEFNLKHRYNIVFLAALIFSFSLSGWILASISMIIIALSSSKYRLGSIFIVATVFLLVFHFGTSYNQGDNLINLRILNRLTYDADKGNISGYNRASEGFENWFDNDFLNSSDVFFGISTDSYNSVFQGIGWRYFVARFGFVGLIAYLFFLFRQRRYFSKNGPTLGLILLYLMFFYQDGQMYLATEFTITFLMGLVLLSDNNKSHNASNL